MELDGKAHNHPDQAAHDLHRTAQLTAHGYHVLRFRNEQVLSDPQSVLDTIAATAASIPVQSRWSSERPPDPPAIDEPSGRPIPPDNE